VRIWAAGQANTSSAGSSDRERTASNHYLPSDSQPSISTAISSQKSIQPASFKTPAFAERLYAYKDVKGKKAAERAAAEQPSFKPKTGRGPAPSYRRNLQGQPIGEYLYEKHYEMEGRREYLTEQTRRETDQLRVKSFMSSTSELLMENLKKRRFNQIFSFLDLGNEGAVDLVGIALANAERLEPLDPEVRADLGGCPAAAGASGRLRSALRG